MSSLKKRLAGRRAQVKRKAEGKLARTMFYRQLGFNVYIVRSAKRIRQADAAKAIGLSRTAFVNLEQGKQGVSVLQLLELARHFRIRPAILLRGLVIGEAPK